MRKYTLLLTCFFIGFFLLTSCFTLLGGKDDDELSEDVLEYLHDRYVGEFEMTSSHWICNEGNLTTGCHSYELTFIDLEEPTRPFWVIVSYGNDTMFVVDDRYNELLISLYVERKMNDFISTICQNCVLGVEVSYLYPESEFDRNNIDLFMEQEIINQSHSKVRFAIIDDSPFENELKYDSLIYTTISQLEKLHIQKGMLEVFFYTEEIEGNIQDLKPYDLTSIYPLQHDEITHVWSNQFDFEYWGKDIAFSPSFIDSITIKRESYY